MLHKNINLFLVTIGVLFSRSHLWLNTDTTFSCSSTEGFQRLPLAIQCTRELFAWVYSLSGRICRRAARTAGWGLAGERIRRCSRRAAGRGVRGSACMGQQAQLNLKQQISLCISPAGKAVKLRK